MCVLVTVILYTNKFSLFWYFIDLKDTSLVTLVKDFSCSNMFEFLFCSLNNCSLFIMYFFHTKTLKKLSQITLIKYRDTYRDTLISYRDMSRYGFFGDTHP